MVQHLVSSPRLDQALVYLIDDVIWIWKDVHSAVGTTDEHVLIGYFLAFEYPFEDVLTVNFTNWMRHTLL